MAATPARQRALTGIKVKFRGHLNVDVDAVPARKPSLEKRTDLRRLCPTCDTPHTLGQQYAGECGEAFTDAQLNEAKRKARELDDGTLIELTADEQEAALKSRLADENVLSLEVWALGDLADCTLPDGTLYRLRPKSKKGATPAADYELLRALAQNAKYVLGGRCNLKGSEKLFRLAVWHGMVVMQGLVRPDEIADFEEIPEADVDADTFAAAIVDMQTSVRPIDPERYHDDRGDRIDAIVTAKQAGTPAELPAAEEGESLADLLEQSLSQVRDRDAAPAA